MARRNDSEGLPAPDGSKRKMTHEVGEGSGEAGRGGERGERRRTGDVKKPEFWSLPDHSESEEARRSRLAAEAASRSIFDSTISRVALAQSWERAIANAPEGEGSVAAADDANRSVPDHVQNRPGPSSPNTVILIDDDDGDGDTDVTLEMSSRRSRR